MDNIRHEEYLHFNEHLPFCFQPYLKRTHKICSTSQNWHENVELQFCLNGLGEVLLDGEIYPFKKGDIIVVNSNVIHYTQTNSTLEYACLIIDTTFFTNIGFDLENTIFLPYISNNTHLQKLFEKLVSVYQTDHELRRPLLHITLMQILLALYENYTVKRLRSPKSPEHFKEIKECIIFLNNNYTQKLSLDDIAKSVYMDKYTLSKEFKKITGQTIVTYLNAYRCKKASRFISEGFSVKNAALKCGFKNMSYFTKTFYNYIGVLPSLFHAKQK